MTAGLTQAEITARISKIEYGEISVIELVHAYVSALGGSIDVVAHIGDRS